MAYLAVIGAFAYAAVSALRTAALRLRLLLVGALAAAAGHLVTDFFLSPDLAGSWLLWMLMGATVVVAGAARDKSAAASPSLAAPRPPGSPVAAGTSCSSR